MPDHWTRLEAHYGWRRVPMRDEEPNPELSLQECRRLLGAEAYPLSDEQLGLLRSQMYSLAGNVLEAFARNPVAEPEAMIPAGMTDSDRDNFEERAAILQFDAKMTREAATRKALTDYAVQATGNGAEPRAVH